MTPCSAPESWMKFISQFVRSSSVAALRRLGRRHRFRKSRQGSPPETQIASAHKRRTLPRLRDPAQDVSKKVNGLTLIIYVVDQGGSHIVRDGSARGQPVPERAPSKAPEGSHPYPKFFRPDVQLLEN